MGTDSKMQRGLYKILTYSTAVAFGTMIASIEAIRMSPTGFTFEISFWTVIAFLLGGAVAFPFWKFIFNATNLSPKQLKWVWSGFLAIMIVLGVGSFLYPLRYVPREKLHDIAVGLAGALLVLSLIGFVVWRIKHFLDWDEKQEEMRSKFTTRDSEDTER